MTEPTEPTIDEQIDQIFYLAAKTMRLRSPGLREAETIRTRTAIQALISDQVAKARIDEAHKAWVLIGNTPSSETGKTLLKQQHDRIATLKKGEK